MLIHFNCAQLCDPMDYRQQAPLSIGFSRQQYWSELPCSPPGIFPTQRLNPCLLCPPALAGGFFTTGATWEAYWEREAVSVMDDEEGSVSHDWLWRQREGLWAKEYGQPVQSRQRQGNEFSPEFFLLNLDFSSMRSIWTPELQTI